MLSFSEGKRLASKRHCKLLEVSALLDHKVDEVLVTILREIRSKQNKLDASSRVGDGAPNDADGATESKGCLQRAAFGIFRKLFK